MNWYAEAQSGVKFLDGVFIGPAPQNLEFGYVDVECGVDGSTKSVVVIWLDVRVLTLQRSAPPPLYRHGGQLVGGRHHKKVRGRLVVFVGELEARAGSTEVI